MTNPIAKNVAKYRKRRGLSCGELAKLANLPRSTVYAVEGGQYDATRSSTIKRLADALGVQPASLLRESKEGGR